MSRSPSIASDSRFSALSGNTGTFPANPTNVRPAPAFIAPFGAVQVLTEHHLTNGNTAPDSDDDIDSLHIKPSKDDVSFTPASLALINAFLDQLLYSFLSAAKSTNLSALKPAVIDILKNKLARDAIASANEELSDLLAGNEEDDGKHPGAKDANGSNNKWDLELVWKRTRLRVMVYMRLGEMEDEDEERYVKEQALHVNGEHSRFSSTSGLVSWSAAIFLTSVLEHVAEQSLQVAGSAAFTRVQRRIRSADEPAIDGPKQPLVIVEEQDAERIAVNPVLGRLWRSWRKTVRANVRPTTPTQHREIASIISPPKSQSSPRDSFGTAPESAHEDEADVADRLADHPPDTQYPEHILASNIRLPMGDALRDVDEIEVPGLARDPSDAGSDAGLDAALINVSERRRSFSNYQSQQAEIQALSSATTDDFADTPPKLKRQRSSSVPTAQQTSVVPSKKVKASTPSKDNAVNGINGAKPSGTAQADVEIDARDDFKALIEDVDNRKSLIDIKTLLAAIDGGAGLFGGDKKLETIEDRPTSSDSKRSFALVDDAADPTPQQLAAEGQHDDSMPSHDTSQIGVATTSDEAVVPERGLSAQGTRSTPSPSHNLYQSSSVPNATISSAISDSTKQVQPSSTVPDVSQRDIPIAPSKRTLAALRESVQRASSPQAVQPNGAPKSASPDAQANRKSLVGQYGPVSAFSNQAQYWETQTPQQAGQNGQVVPRGNRESQVAPPSDFRKSVVVASQEFDQLVQSKEVKKYTLTPESIREIPKSDAQALAQLTGEVPPVVNYTANKDNSDRRSGRSQVTKSVTAASTDDLTPEEKKKRRWSITRPFLRNSAHRKSGMVAREPRVITESTRDFADFIRSTKPDKEPEVLPLATNRSSASLHSLRNSTNFSLPRSHSSNGDRTKSLTRSDIDAGHAPPVPSLPKANKPHMLPKSAKGNDSTGSSELIAFIRDGPKQPDQHRISRSIAPFRSTMDSERFDEFKTSHPVRPEASNKNDGAGTRGQSIYSQNSTLPATDAPINSRSPLANGSSNASNITHPAYSGKVQSIGALSAQPGDSGGVERKRYRNKDPYAMDFMDDDDEDNIEDVSALPRGKRGGESLAEFLRTAESAHDGDSKPKASAASLAQARELRDRARANNVNGNRRESYYSTIATSKQGGATDSASLPPASRGQPSASLDARPPTASRAADRLGLNSSSSNTRDLADFLRNSGPAPAPAPSVSRGTQNQQKAAEKAVKPKKSRGFFSFFRRTPKDGATGRHSDMP